MNTKDSHIPWVGRVPESWDVKRGKAVLDILERPVEPDDNVITCFRDGEVTLRSNRREEGFTISLQEDGYQGIEPGDLVVHGMDGFAGAIGISDSRGKGTPVLNVLDSNQDKRYIMYYLRNMAYTGVFLSLSTGIRIRSCDTNWNKLKNLPYLIPPIEDQSKISFFLSDRCSQIDDIMNQIRSSIDEYKKLKQAIVTHAVTKGIRGDRPMKSSNIIWLGDVPADWSISKIKHTIFPHEKPILPTDNVITCFRDGHVTLRKNRREEGFTVSFTENGYQGVDVGDLVIHGMDTFAGAIGCSDSRGKTSPVVHVCSTTGNNRYFMYFLRYMAYSNVLMDFSNGIRVRSSDFRNFRKLGVFEILVPPPDEQNEIANYLDSNVSKIEQVIQQKELLLTEIDTYKKSLVYEYVTGKKEVPQA